MDRDADNQWIDRHLGASLGVRQLIDALPHLVWIATEASGCEFANRRWQEYSGKSFDALLGMGWTEVLHPDDREAVLAAWREAIESGRDLRIECRFRRHDGAYRWFDNRGVPLRDEHGAVVRWLGSCTDIHEGRAALDALEENAERLRYVELATQDAIYDWDMRSGITHRNERFQQYYGAPPSAHTSERWWETHIHPDDRKRVVDSAAAAFRARRPTWEHDYRFMRSDGTYAEVVDRGYLLYDGNRKPLRMIGAITDITERKRVEQSLRDAQARLLSALAGGALATWIWDVQAQMLAWDEATFRLWGRAPSPDGSVALQQIVEWIHPEDRPRIESTIEEFVRSGEPTLTEFRTIRPDGRLQWLQARGQVQRDAQGAMVRVAGVYADITDRKRAEEAQLRTQKMEALGTLAGGIAHDFNNILLAITGNAKLAIEDLRTVLPAEHAVRRNLAEIEKASARAADLVRRILTFSRKQDTQRAALELKPIIEDALQLLRSTLPATIDIHSDLHTNVRPVLTDAIQIQQLVMNLVTNAAHAIGERHGVIDVQLSEVALDATAAASKELAPGRYACLLVSDTGAGIERAIINRIYDPFFTTKQAGQGTGLGLAVVHGIVKSHHGAIDVESTPGKGTRFRVLLPVTSDVSAVAEASAPAPIRGRGEHVLYVDDEEPLVFLISRVLERMGYRVTGFVDPEQALAALRGAPQSFDVIVTDLSMHTMTGFELARAVRGIRADIPVLLTSGYLRSEDRDTALQCGIREMILKPNTVEELGQAIDRELRALAK